MYVPPKVKPLCPPEERPRFEDVPCARVTLDNGQAYTLKLDIYQSPEQNTPGPCIIYIFGGGFLGVSTNRLPRRLSIAGIWCA
ncbi:MAG: hypothetical protein V8R61_08060 [Enterocloster sp.]